MDSKKKDEILKKYFGYDSFLNGQEVLVESVLSGSDVLGVMPTGAGKSICYQVPAIAFDGITLVISPLISLMKDQVNALTQAGVDAAYINSSLTDSQYARVIRNAAYGIYKIIYVAPERLTSNDFINFANANKISMVAVDEAHCISQWGQDFRPSYMNISNFIDNLYTRPVVGAYTATATERVRTDIAEALNLHNPNIVVTGFDRKNLYFEVRKPKNKTNFILNYLEDKKDQTGIIYCSTRKNVESLFEKLTSCGYEATKYHAGLSDGERLKNQEDFIFDRKNIVVATNAFGMGIDKSNVSYVIHYNMPKDIESYYQEAGRAGRDGSPAECILLYSGQDVVIHQYMIDNTQPEEYKDEETMALLQKRDRERLKIMAMYCNITECLRKYILSYFGENYEFSSCGGCMNCQEDYETADITIDAQKILSCIVRMNERFGINTVLGVLLGKKSKKLSDFGLTSVTTYGIMKGERNEDELRDMINFLINKGYLYVTTDKFTILKLGERAWDILKGRDRVEMRVKAKDSSEENIDNSDDSGGDNDVPRRNRAECPARKSKKINNNVLYDIDSELLSELKAIRLSLANEQKVPAFVIFSDTALVDMCQKMPSDESEFKKVSGVGQVKLERYGALFLSKIAEYRDLGSIKAKTDESKSLENIQCEFEISNSPVAVSVIADRMNSELIRNGLKVSAKGISEWLEDLGYLKAIPSEDGGFKRVPTELGGGLGITSVIVEGRGRVYNQNLYGMESQKFIVENASVILKFIEDRRAAKK